ncbi:RNA-binding domain-containing protein [Linderina pennispora]|uniref:RNA-binding domain-containing protein n=1 Tax=Linderina pennispora TaxID=61395 RepID=A0A1Y1WGP8_9FUNG|nr:RNA-binding domain-containing protein [Linderina pennispora]ORX72730.1 RNA-binding domain-containing protein [Linderina pennispora]
MELNARLDQSLDEIIRETRKQTKKGSSAPKATKSAKKTAAAKKVAAAVTKAAALTTKGKAGRRKKNSSSTGVAAQAALKQGLSGSMAGRLGNPAGSKTAKGVAGRVGKAKGVATKKLETGGRLAGIAEKHRAKKRGVSSAAAVAAAAAAAATTRRSNVNIAIKGEAGPSTIFITNLDTEASAEDVKTCFKQFGTIKNCTLLYDRNGKASGHAEIVYAAKAAALQAVAKLNNVLADGRRLSVQIKPGTESVSSAPGQPAAAVPGTRSGKSRRGKSRSVGGMRMDVD